MVVVALAATLAACGGGSSGSGTQSTTPAPASPNAAAPGSATTGTTNGGAGLTVGISLKTITNDPYQSAWV